MDTPDSSPDQRPQSELSRLEHLTETVLTSAGEGIYGLDAEGRATFVNPAAALMLGWSVEELLGEQMHANHHHSRPDGTDYDRRTCPIYEAFVDGEVHANVDDEVFWRRDGSSFPVEYTSTPIFEGGQPVGAVVVFRDITARKQAEERLRLALEEVEALKDRFAAENDYLREEVGSDLEDLIGESPAADGLRRAIRTVAAGDTSVLVTGETGTGKELVARSIHALGPRAERPLIKVNCASIPRELFEAEFFGHVQGAFTGALRDRAGRFELADGGTLFLDEVGEIPLEMQSKLLRVLQEGELERVGEERTRTVDVRLIAATNRDLRAEIAEGRFRQDLYYRLNVFPIEVAPLRERREDVTLLAEAFLDQLARKAGRPRPRISAACRRELTAYPWPGNVRELQNVIERALVTTSGAVLDLRPFDPEMQTTAPPIAASVPHPAEVLTDKELRNLERQNLEAALRAAEGRVYGKDGAAELLGMRPTTLASRLRSFGIDRRTFEPRG